MAEKVGNVEPVQEEHQFTALAVQAQIKADAQYAALLEATKAAVKEEQNIVGGMPESVLHEMFDMARPIRKDECIQGIPVRSIQWCT